MLRQTLLLLLLVLLTIPARSEARPEVTGLAPLLWCCQQQCLGGPAKQLPMGRGRQLSLRHRWELQQQQ